MLDSRPTNKLFAISLFAAALLVASCTTVEPQFVSSDPRQQAETRIELGMGYLRLNQLEVAEQEFEKALQFFNRADRAYHGLGLIAARRQNDAKALSFFQKAVNLNGDNVKAVSDYAILLCRNNQAREGLVQLQKIAAKGLDKGDLGVSLAFGVCNLRLNRYAEAGQAYSSALSLSPRLEQALLPMAEIKRKLGQPLGARAYIERYFGAGYSSPKGLLLGAEVELLLDNRQQHLDYLQKLWARYPNSSQARAARERYQ